MKCFYLFGLLIIICFGFSCSSDESNPNATPTEESLYFPPINSDAWETISPNELNWNADALPPLLNFLENSSTKAFMIVYNGRIVNESYFNGSTMSSNNPWFSAGKTLTAFMVGIAQEQGALDLMQSSSDYLGHGWSSLTETQEDAITVRNHITMTSGLDYTDDLFCTDTECLTFLNEPSTSWYYHNAPYTLTQDIISGALNADFDTFFNSELKNKIGMQGSWIPFGYNRFYFSNARSMARFGLLCLNKGVWNDAIIMEDTNYFNAMTSSSQDLNPAYGYLWWLNGQSSFMLPGSSNSFNGKLIPNAPDDLIAGLGANDQKLYVVPSRKLVIVRMGDDGGEAQLGPSGYDNLLWEYLNAVID